MSDTESTNDDGSINNFRDSVKKWLEIGDELVELRKSVAKLNKAKKFLGENITKFMNDNEKEICNLGDSGALELKPKKTTVALSKKSVEKLLLDFLKDEHTAKESTEYIFSNREVKHTKVLNLTGAL